MRLRDVSTAVVTPQLQFDELAMTIAMVLASNGGACCTGNPEADARTLLAAVEHGDRSSVGGGSQHSSDSASAAAADDDEHNDPTATPSRHAAVGDEAKAGADSKQAAGGARRSGLKVRIENPASSEPVGMVIASKKGSSAPISSEHWFELQKVEGRAPISLNEQMELLFQWQPS